MNDGFRYSYVKGGTKKMYMKKKINKKLFRHVSNKMPLNNTSKLRGTKVKIKKSKENKKTKTEGVKKNT